MIFVGILRQSKQMNAEPHGLFEPDIRERILIVRLSKPKSGKAAPIAAIILGIGMADLAAAARFVRHGWLAMQVRLISDTAHHGDLVRRYDTYDASGVSRCREAMDYVERTHGVRRFVLMGSCALANICLKSAIADSRVAGLILTNPYMPENFLAGLWLRIRRNLFNGQSWQRLLRGGVQLQRQADPAETRLRSYTGDAALSPDFPGTLQRLATQRGVRILMALSRPEAIILSFRRQYRKALRQLATRGQIRLEVLPTESHDFSETGQAATKLNDLIRDWLRSSWGSSDSLPRPLRLAEGRSRPKLADSA